MPAETTLALEIVMPARRWQRPIKRLNQFARLVAETTHAAATAEGARALTGPVTLAFVRDSAVRRLNRDFRAQDKPTNVLSFPAVNGLGGDVILALETIAAEAAAQGKDVRDHTAHLIAHGILHLMGYDHQTAKQARPMEALERAVLACFGIADPYD